MLEIEYIESFLPPSRLATLPHEEWVSSITCSVPGFASIIYSTCARRVLTMISQPFPHRLIRRDAACVRPRAGSPSHRAIAWCPCYVLRYHAIIPGLLLRRPTRRNCLPRSHGTD